MEAHLFQIFEQPSTNGFTVWDKYGTCCIRFVSSCLFILSQKTTSTEGRYTQSWKMTKTVYQEWTRLNYKGVFHDNRRLLQHRAKNCECFVCCREIYKLPPMETQSEYLTALKTRIELREIKKAKKTARKEVREGKQGQIDEYFRRADSRRG